MCFNNLLSKEHSSCYGHQPCNSVLAEPQQPLCSFSILIIIIIINPCKPYLTASAPRLTLQHLEFYFMLCCGDCWF
jgi:hypothetical protein